MDTKLQVDILYLRQNVLRLSSETEDELGIVFYAKSEIQSQNITSVDLYEHTLDRLRKGVAIFIFRKKDGTYRKAIGTLNEATIPTEKGDEARSYHKPSPLNQTFYDLQTLQFRSFNVDSVVALIDF